MTRRLTTLGRCGNDYDHRVVMATRTDSGRTRTTVTGSNGIDRAAGIHCFQCDYTPTKEDGSPVTHLPPSWHEHGESVWCSKCWSEAYVLRAVTIPVAGPIDSSWKELSAKLHACWNLATVASNLAVTELRRMDVTRTPEMAKLPSMPSAADGTPALTYLYRATREALPELAPRSVTSLLQRVARNYRADRWDVIWTGRKSLRNYRYPQPYPAHNQAWQAEHGPEGEPIISVELGAGDRWRIRLKRGKHLRRQLDAFRQLVEGDALRGELALIRRSRDGAVLAKLVMWLPRNLPRTQQRKGTLVVVTAADSFLRYDMEGSGRIQHLHADHVRRWVAEHRRRLDRLADDTKAERRRPQKNMRGIQAQREVWVDKHRARMQTWTHEVSRVIAGYAERQGVAKVQWDDRARSYLPDAPYADIRTKLAYKLDEAGVELEIMESENGEAANKS